MTTTTTPWYVHRRLDTRSRTTLTDRQLSERASWRATLDRTPTPGR